MRIYYKTNIDHSLFSIGKITTFIPMKENRMICFLAALLFLVCGNSLWAQNKLGIISEYVAVEMQSDHTLRTSGMYVFQNTATLQSEYPIFFPFSKEKEMGDIIDYEVKGDVEIVQLQNDGISFRFNIQPDDIDHFWLTYTQECLSDTAKYIFSSTGYWKNALKEFQFTLLLPEKWELIESDFIYDETWNENGRNYYRFQRNEYIPQENFTVIFLSH